MIVIVMGVSGAGKTTVGQRLAERLGARFAEGDAFHPPANIAKMQSGTPLDDADRWPWLDAIAAALEGWARDGQSVVLACSALKRRYRERLTRGLPGLRFVHLRGDRATIAPRLAARRGHFMPASLLDSQLAALEEPGPDEPVLVLDIREPPERIVEQAVTWLGFEAAVGNRPGA